MFKSVETLFRDQIAQVREAQARRASKDGAPSGPVRTLEAWLVSRGVAVKLTGASDMTLPVRVYRGQWVADCPFCGARQLVSVTDPRFYCPSPDCCQGGVNGLYGRSVQLEVPFPLGVLGTELVLSLRPSDKNRNMDPGQTVEQLLDEGVKHGVLTDRIVEAVELLRPRWEMLAKFSSRFDIIPLAEELAMWLRDGQPTHPAEMPS